MDTLAQRLRQYRKDNGLTQTQAARLIGIPQSSLCRAENGGKTDHELQIREHLDGVQQPIDPILASLVIQRTKLLYLHHIVVRRIIALERRIEQRKELSGRH